MRCKRHHRLDCDICFPKTVIVEKNEGVPEQGEGQTPGEVEFDEAVDPDQGHQEGADSNYLPLDLDPEDIDRGAIEEDAS